jgi:hypothetical protein
MSEILSKEEVATLGSSGMDLEALQESHELLRAALHEAIEGDSKLIESLHSVRDENGYPVVQRTLDELDAMYPPGGNEAVDPMWVLTEEEVGLVVEAMQQVDLLGASHEAREFRRRHRNEA